MFTQLKDDPTAQELHHIPAGYCVYLFHCFMVSMFWYCCFVFKLRSVIKAYELCVLKFYDMAEKLWVM